MTQFHGLDVEQVIERHPKVHRALIGGDGQDSTCLLIELESTTIKDQVQGSSEEWKARALEDICAMVDKEVNTVVADVIEIERT